MGECPRWPVNFADFLNSSRMVCSFCACLLPPRDFIFHSSRIRERDFPSGPLLKAPPSTAGDTGSIPGQGGKILHASGPKNEQVKQKQYCNRFSKDLKRKPPCQHLSTLKKKESMRQSLRKDLRVKRVQGGAVFLNIVKPRIKFRGTNK